MAYTKGNLALITPGTLAQYGASSPPNGGGIWWLYSTDTLAQILAANYISDGAQRGLSLGDIVIVSNGSTSVWLAAVTAVASTPPFTPGQTTNFGVTLSTLSSSPNSTGVAAQYTTAALQSAAIPAANVAGADFVVFDNTGVTPGNLQLPTAAAILAVLPANVGVGFSWVLEVKNSSSGANTLTLTTNTGLTLTGTMTAAQNIARRLIATVTAIGASPAITFQSFGVSGTGAD